MEVKLGLTQKLLIAVLIPVFAGTMVIFVVSLKMMREAFELNYQNQSEAIVETLGSGIGSLDDLRDKISLRNQIYKLVYTNPELVAVRVNLINSEGNLETFVSSEVDGEGIIAGTYSQKAYDENVIVSDTDGQGEVAKYISSSPIEVSGQRVGTFEIALSYAPAYRAFVLQVIYFVAGMLILFTSISLLVYFLSTRLILNPIKKLVQGAEIIGSGELSYRIQVEFKDELGRLAEVINIAAESLEKSYTDLEGKVSERTEELNEKVGFISQQNKSLEDRKVAMINLLEDEKELELQLKVEKESVEKKVVERTRQVLEEKAKLDGSIESLPVGYIMVDMSSSIINMNSAAISILEIDDKTKAETKLNEVFDFTESCQKVVKELKKTGLKEVVFGGKTLQAIVSPVLLGDKKEAIGSVMIVEDITERKVLERSKDEFFSIASHELRTPLTAIRGNTSMILDYYANEIKNPEVKTMIDDTHKASIRLIGIVNDFLDMSRLEQGKMEYKIEDILMGDMVKKVAKDLQENAKVGGNEIVVLESENYLVKGDVGKVEQILFNLFGNALKFTEKGKVSVEVKAVLGMVTVEVTDTGRGIPIANQGILFHKFQQAGDSLTTRDTFKGTGLGLYISKLMAQGMGGDVTLIRSEENKGSTFGFSIPISNSK